MKIIEYNEKYDEQIKDLLVELQNYLIEIDDWNTQILHKDYRDEYFKIDMNMVKDYNGKIYLAEQNKEIVGMIIGIVQERDKIDYITNDCAKTGVVLELIVKKDIRGKGAGKILLNEIEKYFKSINCKRISIDVFGPNKDAYNFYYKNGYIEREVFMGKKMN